MAKRTPLGLTGLNAVRGSNQFFDSNLVNFCPIFQIYFLLKACKNCHLFIPKGRAKRARRALICEYFQIHRGIYLEYL